MPTPEEERQAVLNEEYKKLKQERSSQQGIITGHLTRLIAFVDTNDGSRAQECQVMADRMLSHKEKHEVAFNKLCHFMGLHGMDVTSVEKKAEKLKKEIVDTYKTAMDWLLEVQTRDGDLESSSSEYTIAEETVLSAAKTETSEVALLKEQLKDLKQKLTGLDDAQFEIGAIRDTLRISEERRVHDEQHYKDQMKQMQDVIQDEKEENNSLRERIRTSTPRANPRLSSIREEESRRGVDSEDMLAISQIVASSNAEIMKQMFDRSVEQQKTVLERSVEQQKTLYQSMQSPKVKLPTFEGDYTSYHSFISRYDDLIGDTDSADSVKLNTLLQSCGPTVLKHLDCCNYKRSSEGYILAKKILKEKYGNPFLVSQAWVEKVLEHPKMKHAEEILLYASELRSCHESLTSLGFLSDMENTGNMREIINKVPGYIQNRWRKCNREKIEKGTKATLKNMIDVITESAEEQADPVYGYASLSKLSSKPGEKDSRKPKTRREQSHVMTEETFASETTSKEDVKPKRPIKCSFCGEGHFPRLCPGFEKKNPAARLKMVKEKGLCILCLNPYHTVAKCHMRWTCQEPGCTRRHNTTLHLAFSEKARDTTEKDEEEQNDTVAYFSRNTGVTYHSHGGNSYSLPIIPVYIEGKKGLYDTNVLMDSGSTLTFITEDLFNRLGLVPYDVDELTMTSMTGRETFEAPLVNFNAKPSDNNVWQTLFGVAVVKKLPISGHYVQRLQDVDRWPYLKNLNIKYVESEKIDILIGQNNAKMFKRLMEVGGETAGTPYAIRTLLGWMIMGHYVNKRPKQLPVIQSNEDVEPIYRYKTDYRRAEAILTCAEIEPLENKVDRLWAIESVPEVIQESPLDQKIKADWDKRACMVDGHLEVPIPFKKEPPCLPDNRVAVEKRMKSLGKRMKSDPLLKEKCMETMKNDFDKGYAEVKPKHKDTGYTWFVPIQPVVTYTEKRPGKCRLVGDLSHRFQDRCLNDEVHQGPNYTKSLFEMLIKFRQFQYAITGDIKEMFNQVRVPEIHRDCLSFLWWLKGDLEEELTECRMLTQMFGGTWCPATSQYALEWVAKHPQKEYDIEVIETILKHFYVDDMLRSIWDEEFGYNLLMKVRELLQEIGFELCKLGSSSMLILNRIPVELRAKEYKEIEFDVPDTVTTPMLGSSWRPGPDDFGFKAEVADKQITKRGVLSGATSLFDPLGLIALFVLRAKSLVQQLFKEQFGWDELLPAVYNKQWTVWMAEVPEIKQFSIPRWIGMTKNPEDLFRLHVFVDASTKGYGAVVYLEVADNQGKIKKTTLVTAKAKVAPVKPMTVPRLELCAAVLGVKLGVLVERSLGEGLQDTTYWSDSTIVLWYINSQAWRYKTFVSNRIAYVQEKTRASQWKYVPTELNVADHASRGMSAKDLVMSDIWKRGPEFIQGLQEKPEQPDLRSKEKDPEVKRQTVYAMFCSSKKSTDENDKKIQETFLAHHSEWDVLVRRLCLWRRIIAYMKTKKRQRGFFTVEERRLAQNRLFGFIQNLHLTTEQRDSRVFKKLFPYSEDGLYRVGGRLVMSTMDYDQKHPPILPPCDATCTYVRYVHDRFGHGGVDRTFHDVRQNVWIVGGKRTIKKAIGDCMICRKIKGPFGQQIMSPLPTFRVERGTVPFDVVGVDYFGPMYIKVGRTTQKRYICMFTDMKIRATHVEVAQEMTTSSFLMALQRFIARRGRPSMIISDNGTNFVGANRELKTLFKNFNHDYIGNKMAELGIKWQFNTPLASHHGGAWERLIRSFRVLFMAVAGTQTLTEETLATFAANTEQIMNSRPLTRVSEDPEDEAVITPEHLINIRAAGKIPGGFDGADALRAKWKQVLYLADLFWKKWVKVYLQQLQLRQKWIKPMKDLKKNDLVLVMDTSLPRLEWPMGLVKEVFIGKDGHVRSALVKTKNGEYQRPISKLVFLECSG